jgi:hypothetical protein
MGLPVLVVIVDNAAIAAKQFADRIVYSMDSNHQEI